MMYLKKSLDFHNSRKEYTYYATKPTKMIVAGVKQESTQVRWGKRLRAKSGCELVKILALVRRHCLIAPHRPKFQFFPFIENKVKSMFPIFQKNQMCHWCSLKKSSLREICKLIFHLSEVPPSFKSPPT